MTELFLQAFVFFLIYVLVHCVFCRFQGSTRFFAKNLELFLFFVLISSTWILYTSHLLSALVFFFSFYFLWAAYTIVLVNFQNSVSLQLMEEISKSPDQVLEREKLEESVPDERNIESRLIALQNNRLVIFNKITLEVFLTPLGNNFAKVALFLRKAMKISDSG